MVWAGEVGWYGSGCQVSSDTRPTGGISALASLSFHCQYIPPSPPPLHTRWTHQTHHTNFCMMVYMDCTQIYMCIIHLILYCQNVQSRQWSPSVVTLCVCCCALWWTIGWNASNLSTAHWEDTPDTLLVNAESIFFFLQQSLHIWSICQLRYFWCTLDQWCCFFTIKNPLI